MESKMSSKPWRYVDWLGGQEEFDNMFAKYPLGLGLPNQPTPQNHER